MRRSLFPSFLTSRGAGAAPFFVRIRTTLYGNGRPVVKGSPPFFHILLTTNFLVYLSKKYQSVLSNLPIPADNPPAPAVWPGRGQIIEFLDTLHKGQQPHTVVAPCGFRTTAVASHGALSMTLARCGRRPCTSISVCVIQRHQQAFS